MRRSLAFLFGALLAGVLVAPAVAADSAGSEGADGFTIKDPRITESSGLVASRAHPGVYWTHNDSDDGAFLYAVDSKTGETVATVTMTGVGRPRDVEAISMGPNGHLYVGDVGDNLGGTWDHVWIYELPEPKQLKNQTVRATQYDVKYADGARDAEALMVHPKTGRVYIVSKNEDGGGLYEGPAELTPSGTNTFKRIGAIDLWVTDGAFSPDGKQLAVRGYFGGLAYKWNGGKVKKEGRLSVPLQGQGESMAYTPDGSTLLYGSEGSGSSVEPGNVPGGGGGDGKSPSGEGGSADGGGGGDGMNADIKMGAVALVVALAVIYGLKRLLRRD
ncbi:WD40 repeat domain-containing protein [Streptomyces sp. NBC_00258]|uniref:WD40 repeat domain-containing protein n=1 Tax=Streptomyces sp. NBC_00258 TaxID=2903642 RepID=UPI002E280137|nr:WD40 repeat domain-containing protein [Streptomyces sp. NBC_00258]